MKKTTEKLEHESKYHMAVLRVLMKDLGESNFWCEVKVCRGATFNPNCIRLKQRAMLANPYPVGIHISDVAMDFGGSRGLDLVCAEYKYLCIVFLKDEKPYVICILMEEETINTILKKSSKLDDLLKVYKSFPL